MLPLHSLILYDWEYISSHRAKNISSSSVIISQNIQRGQRHSQAWGKASGPAWWGCGTFQLSLWPGPDRSETPAHPESAGTGGSAAAPESLQVNTNNTILIYSATVTFCQASQLSTNMSEVIKCLSSHNNHFVTILSLLLQFLSLPFGDLALW